MSEVKRDCYYCKHAHCWNTDDKNIFCQDEHYFEILFPYYDGEYIEDTKAMARDCEDFEYDDTFPRNCQP